jgi:hypothetical protein
MNEFFYVSRGKEKIKDLRHEGMQNQAFHRSGAGSRSLAGGLLKLILGLLGVLGLLALLIH